MDVTNNEFVATGLSMPHSPRWYQDQLWVLESGKGTLATVDLANGSVDTVAELPGFTRGLAFSGDLAFVGLSEVRETAVFGSIPITERVADRTCGVWVVDIRSGELVAFLRFEGSVHEVFAVEILKGVQFPDLIQTDEALIDSSFVMPTGALQDVVGTG